MPHDVLTTEVSGSPMEVFRFFPPAMPVAGLVLAQHIPFGHTGIENDPFTLRCAERYAAAGYSVVVPFIFHWWPKNAPIEIKREQSRDELMVADIGAALDVLGDMDGVAGKPLGIVGHCWGGRVAWLAACHYPQFAAAVVFYGGRIVRAMGDGPAPIDLTASMRCAVAGFFGNDDHNPPPGDVDRYQQALQKAGVRHALHRYDGAGHGFQDDTSEARYRPQQSEDAWHKALQFLHDELRSS